MIVGQDHWLYIKSMGQPKAASRMRDSFVVWARRGKPLCPKSFVLEKWFFGNSVANLPTLSIIPISFREDKSVVSFPTTSPLLGFHGRKEIRPMDAYGSHEQQSKTNNRTDKNHISILLLWCHSDVIQKKQQSNLTWNNVIAMFLANTITIESLSNLRVCSLLAQLDCYILQTLM